MISHGGGPRVPHPDVVSAFSRAQQFSEAEAAVKAREDRQCQMTEQEVAHGDRYRRGTEPAKHNFNNPRPQHGPAEPKS